MMWRIVLVPMIATVAGAAAAQTPGELPFSITIRSHNTSVSQEEFGVARRVASDILGEAGLAVSWLQCLSNGTPPAPAQCGQPLDDNELILMIERAPRRTARLVQVWAPTPQRQALGVSYVDTQAGRGTLATVYSERVKNLSRGTGVDSADLLARVIAHEIGHLLLGTSRHALSGLMRAAWSHADVRRNEASDWRFSESESRAMRNAVSVRMALSYARHP
jgi:hypothetical protein